MATFHRLESKTTTLPSMLSALEEQNFLFQLQLQDKGEEDSAMVRRNLYITPFCHCHNSHIYRYISHSDYNNSD